MSEDFIPFETKKLAQYYKAYLDSLSAILQQYIDFCYEAEKIGHWVRVLVRNDKGGCIGARMICSECGNESGHDEFMQYCPNCGIYMNKSASVQVDEADTVNKYQKTFVIPNLKVGDDPTLLGEFEGELLEFNLSPSILKNVVVYAVEGKPKKVYAKAVDADVTCVGDKFVTVYYFR